MFQLYIVVSGSGEAIDFGPAVDTLEETSAILRTLDWLWENHPGAHWVAALKFYEGSDAYVRHTTDGRIWASNDEMAEQPTYGWRLIDNLAPYFPEV